MPGPTAKKSTYEKGLDNLFELCVEEAKGAVSDIAFDVASIASTIKAPVKTANLRGNIDPDVKFKVDRIKRTVSKDIVAATDYALVQHENTSFRHPKGGQAKYLTSTLEEKASPYADLLGARIQRALQRAEVKK